MDPFSLDDFDLDSYWLSNLPKEVKDAPTTWEVFEKAVKTLCLKIAHLEGRLDDLEEFRTLLEDISVAKAAL